jgi:hypothetical protein
MEIKKAFLHCPQTALSASASAWIIENVIKARKAGINREMVNVFILYRI